MRVMHLLNFRNQRPRKQHYGLSLIELLVVMAIIAMLVAITLVVTRGIYKFIHSWM